MFLNFLKLHMNAYFLQQIQKRQRNPHTHWLGKVTPWFASQIQSIAKVYDHMLSDLAYDSESERNVRHSSLTWHPSSIFNGEFDRSSTKEGHSWAW